MAILYIVVKCYKLSNLKCIPIWTLLAKVKIIELRLVCTFWSDHFYPSDLAYTSLTSVTSRLNFNNEKCYQIDLYNKVIFLKRLWLGIFFNIAHGSLNRSICSLLEMREYMKTLMSYCTVFLRFYVFVLLCICILKKNWPGLGSFRKAWILQSF